MQLLFDFLPIIAFFAAAKLADMYVATVVLIVACRAAGSGALASARGA
jgi:intracellular septation protein A